MATALLSGLLAGSEFPRDHVRACDVSEARRAALSQDFGITTVADNVELVKWAECLVLAVKPQVVEAALAPCRGAFSAEQLVISVCAGVTIEQLSGIVGAARVLRVMPNTPALVGAGATAVARGPSVTADDERFASELFQLVGKCWWVSEAQLDAVTGLSGSGPAYVMLFIEALADGGVRSGLPRDVALELATQTVIGSARLLEGSATHPAELRDRVTSPAGTTSAGLFALERAAFRHAVIDAVCSATERSRELGGGRKSS